MQSKCALPSAAHAIKISIKGLKVCWILTSISDIPKFLKKGKTYNKNARVSTEKEIKQVQAVIFNEAFYEG